jgi:hypothetical protein
MRLLTLFLLAAALAACDVEQGPPLYNNPAPIPETDIPTGQPHTDCPGGYTFC